MSSFTWAGDPATVAADKEQHKIDANLCIQSTYYVSYS